MKKQNDSSSKQNSLRIAMILIALTVVAVGIGVSAKYVTQKKVFTGNLHVTAKLFTSMEIWEHQIVENGDSYTLDPSTTVSGNNYKLHPNIPVPKDPTIYITGKTSLKAYLYVEVVDAVSQGSGNCIQYQMEDHWMDTGLTGQHNGKIYVYANNNVPVEVYNDPTPNITVPILKNNEITVDSTWEPDSTSGLELTFYAYMVQVQEGVDYQAAFTNAFMTANTTDNP